jgi:hypothetical protein
VNPFRPRFELVPRTFGLLPVDPSTSRLDVTRSH